MESNLNRWVLNTCLFAVVGIFILFLSGCESKPNELAYTEKYPILMDIHTSAENLGGWDNSEFVDGDYSFGASKMQTNKVAHTGSYSCEVVKGYDFGLTLKLDGVNVGDYVEISVWKFAPNGKGALHVSSDKVGNLYHLVSQTMVKEESGWEKIVVNVPILKTIDKLIVACYNPNENPVYFDDLSVKVFKSRPIYYDENDVFALQISDSNSAVLENLRKEAIELGVISKKQKKYVKAQIAYQGEIIPVKIRYKGDWTDHLQGDKWSFRVKVAKGYSFKGLKSFNIQSPHTRSFMKEWFFHRVFENLGLLTTRYDFIPVSLNGKNLGVFALEEHFDKQLLESRGRREGPILKVDEEGFWERVVAGQNNGTAHEIPYYEASAILPFKKNRTMKNDVLKQEFLIAQNLLFNYKTWQSNIEDVFNLRALAQYHAIMDIGAINHAQGNQRTYYNPVTSRLEPIAYDLYTEISGEHYRAPISGLETMNGDEFVFRDLFFNYNVFMQSAFQKEYLNQLKVYSDPAFLKNQEQELMTEIERYNNLLGQEYGGYTFTVKAFEDVCENIRAKIPEYESKMKSANISFTAHEASYDDLENDSVYYSQTGLKAYAKKLDSTSSVVQCLNYHMGPIEIIGYSVKGHKDSLIQFDQSYALAAYSSYPAKAEISIPGHVSRLFLTVPSMPDSVISKKVVPWRYPELNQIPRITLENKVNLNTKHYTIKDDVITLKSMVNLNDVLFIPSGYTVEILAGTQINLGNQAGIVSYSPMYFNGATGNRIKVNGTSNSNFGVQILTDGDTSMFHYVDFKGMSTLNYHGWMLTGGLTVYKGDVSLQNCSFTGNHCEDAVNLINSTFKMNDCVIESTFSDGLDADFCTGSISNCVVKNAGNDGLDFSGSTIDITNSHIIKPFDKALSGGEASTVSIKNSTISHSMLAVVAKDNSVVTVSDLTFEDCKVVYALFQKKDEYGPAKIIATRTKASNCGTENLIDLGSVLEVNGKQTIGVAKQNVDSLYVISNGLHK